MNLLRMIQSAKKIHGKSPQLDETALTTEVDSKLTISAWVDWINDAQQYHQNETLQAAEDYFGSVQTVTMVAGTQEYSLQGNEIQLRSIERTDTDPDRIIHPISINDRLFYEPRYSNWNIWFMQFLYLSVGNVLVVRLKNISAKKSLCHKRKSQDSPNATLKIFYYRPVCFCYSVSNYG